MELIYPVSVPDSYDRKSDWIALTEAIDHHGIHSKECEAFKLKQRLPNDELVPAMEWWNEVLNNHFGEGFDVEQLTAEDQFDNIEACAYLLFTWFEIISISKVKENENG
jgi:hypothetical protein